jgi:hypothetical protein
MPTVLFVSDRSADTATTQEDAWRRGYAALRQFRTRVGHCCVPVRHIAADGCPLGHWVEWQRQLDRHGRLRPERRRLLDLLGFDWQPRGRWRSATIAAAIEAASQDPSGWMWTFDRSLIRSLRVARRRGRLSSEQIVALDAIGFAWSSSDAHFARGIAALRGYRAAGGSLPVGRAVVWGGVRLGEWVRRVRGKAETGRLSEPRWEAVAAAVCEPAAQTAPHEPETSA